jgi:hypothetical protein
MQTKNYLSVLGQLAKLKKLLPTYADKRVMGAVAAMVIPDNVGRYDFACRLPKAVWVDCGVISLLAALNRL